MGWGVLLLELLLLLLSFSFSFGDQSGAVDVTGERGREAKAGEGGHKGCREGMLGGRVGSAEGLFEWEEFLNV